MKLLIVDGETLDRSMLADYLGQDYSLQMSDSGEEALAILAAHRNNIDLVLLELNMPDIDGSAVLRRMGELGWLEDTPVITISSQGNREVEEQSLELGAVDFIRKPFDKHVVRRRVQNVVELFRYKRSLEAQVKRVEESNEIIIDVLGTMVELRDMDGSAHIHRVKGFTRILAHEVMEKCPKYGLTDEDVEQIASASALHDIGKITIPDSILLKKGRLTPEEFERMKSHTTRGGEILDQIQGAWEGAYGQACYEICLYHHERWDGTGYPDGLKGESIPISAQIVSLADVYDALVSKRCYKNAYPLDQAFDMILSGQCGVFSPNLLSCLRSVRKQFEALALDCA